MSSSVPATKRRRRLWLASTILAPIVTLGISAAHAQQSPALDRVSIAVGAFNAEPKIHAAGDTDNYGRVETPEAKTGHTTLPRVKAEVLFGDSQACNWITSATTRITIRPSVAPPPTTASRSTAPRAPTAT